MNFQLPGKSRRLPWQGLFALASFAWALLARAAPVILNHSTFVAPGSVITLQGSDFGSAPQIWVSLNGGTYSLLATLNTGDNTITAQLPSTGTGLYSVYVSGSDGNSPAVYLNSAVGYHFDESEVIPGGTFRLIGRNLVLAGFSPRVDLVNTSTGTDYTATVNANPGFYVLSVTVPASVPTGTYNVFVSNGAGDWNTVKYQVQYQMTVRTAGTDYWNLGVAWANDLKFFNNVYNVLNDPRLSQHAVGNGVNNDLAAINAAIVAANAAGGGVVYLPTGTYLVQNTSGDLIVLLSNVVLQGDGPNSTIINYGYGTPASGSFALRFTYSSTLYGVANLQFNNVNQTGSYTNNPIYTSSSLPSNRYFLSNVRHVKSTEGSSTFYGNQFLIKNCVITGYNGPLAIGAGSTNFNITGNSITYSANTCLGLNGSSAAYVGPGIVENNTINPDLSATTNLGVRHSMEVNFDVDVLFLNNTVAGLNGPGVDNNDCESFNSEGGGSNRPGESTGTVVSASGNTVNVNASGTYTAGAVMAIVYGTGRGQWQTITGWNGATVTVAGDWTVPPDSTSSYSTFKWSLREVTLLGNNISSVPRGIWIYTGAATDVAIAGNTLTNADGIYLRPDQRLATGRFDIVYNTQAVQNTLSETNALHAAYLALEMYQVNPTTTLGSGAINVEIRQNSIAGSNTVTFPSTTNPWHTEGYACGMVNQSGTYVDQSIPGVLGTVLQWNQASNIATGNFYIDSESYYTSIANNPLTTTAQINDTTITGASHTSVGTFIRITPSVSVTASSQPADEYGTVPSTFTVNRTGATTADVAVNYTVSGSAVAGTDYQVLAGTVVIPPGAASANVTVQPLGDNLSGYSAGVGVNLTADTLGNYALASPNTATLNIANTPTDAWRLSNFTTAQLANSAISGDFADPANDGVANVLKRFFGLQPFTNSSGGHLPEVSIVNGYLQLTYRRVAGLTDLSDFAEVTSTVGSPASWSSASQDVQLVPPVVDNGDGTETVTYQDQHAASGFTGRFIRLVVNRLFP